MPINTAQIVRMLTLCRLFIRWRLMEKYSLKGWRNLWVFLNPLLQLGLFLIFFSIFFEAKWGPNQDGESLQISGFILGLLFYWSLVECLGLSVSSIRSNQHIISKVIFPILILPISSAGLTFISFTLQLAIFLIFFIITSDIFSVNQLWFIWVLVIFLVFLLGTAFLFSWLGAVFKDLSHLMNIIALGLMFLSPVFYKIDKLPEWIHPLFLINPLSFFIETGRDCLVDGNAISLVTALLITLVVFAYFVVSVKIFSSGKTRYANVD